MRHLNKLILACLLWSPWLFASEPSGSEPYVNEQQSPAEQLSEYLDKLEQMHASFSHPSGDSMQRGEVWLAKPDRFRIETGPPLSQVLVSDGTTLVTHDLDLEQVILSNLDEQADNIPVLLFAGDPDQVAGRFSIESFADELRHHFVLTPVDPASLFTKIVLSFDHGIPTGILVENGMHERTQIDLQPITNTGVIPNELFAYEPPPGTDVIDDR